MRIALISMMLLTLPGYSKEIKRKISSEEDILVISTNQGILCKKAGPEVTNAIEELNKALQGRVDTFTKGTEVYLYSIKKDDGVYEYTIKPPFSISELTITKDSDGLLIACVILSNP